MARLIVNADDFGVYACVSRGILEAVQAGAVTAVGVMATGRAFGMAEELLPLAAQRGGGADAGAHLVLTAGEPLTERMRRICRGWAGRFPPLGTAALSVLAGRIPVAAVAEEWRAQIALCRKAGLRLVFLNSHEHIHMLPPLFRLTRALARENGVRWVRAPRTSLSLPQPAKRLAKELVFKALRVCAGPTSHFCAAQPVLLGTGESGRLTPGDLARLVKGVRGEGDYELMCHPGRFDPAEITDERLRAFHDWEGELEALLSPAFGRLLAGRGARLVRFSDLAAARS
ncbi:YdjC family protein [Desulfovibrio sp. X2]|uniref:carbohydrate deacetylase n=1 Tax=Desulfovibrio sp. X2 TaxID=941449 RepID=UPI0003587CFE|nr:ChbG/HpnK family deacetylase [Desulfovibrio sp. X2]EPR41077.1 YdjC family protein [Desulfovibrio sp. X2]